MIKAVLLDLIGTTVKSSQEDYIVTCLQQSFLEHKLHADGATIKNNRGRDKRVMIGEVLKQNGASADRVQAIYQSFQDKLQNGLDSFSEVAGVPQLFKFLQERNILLGIGSGLPKSLFDPIHHHLGWSRYKLDYVGISEVIGKSRPDPAMIIDMMKKLRINSPAEVLKVGDTVADIQEGKNAGVHTAVVLAGTQDEAVLRKETPDFVLRALTDLQHIRLLQGH